MAEFKKLSAVETVEVVSDAANVLIEENGVIKRAPKTEVGGGVKRELVYEWNFSAEDEVYEIYENINEDLSWLTKKQDDISFEIVTENYACQYEWNHEEGFKQNSMILEDVFAVGSSTEVPYFSRGVNIPYFYYEQQFTCKEALFGAIYGYDFDDDHPIDDTIEKCFELRPSCDFYIYNGLHVDFDNDGTPIVVENGGTLMLEASAYPFKSVKIYKVYR